MQKFQKKDVNLLFYLKYASSYIGIIPDIIIKIYFKYTLDLNIILQIQIFFAQILSTNITFEMKIIKSFVCCKIIMFVE